MNGKGHASILSFPMLQGDIQRRIELISSLRTATLQSTDQRDNPVSMTSLYMGRWEKNIEKGNRILRKWISTNYGYKGKNRMWKIRKLTAVYS